MGTPQTLPAFEAPSQRETEDHDARNDDDDMPGLAIPITRSRLRVHPAAKWLEAAKNMPTPRELWMKTWYEGELCCLFADSNVGKSIYAMQIALHVAQMGLKVLYCDFELSEKQFQRRYTDEEGNLFAMPANLIRADINPDLAPRERDEIKTSILDDITEAALRENAEVIIVDNITYLSMLTESGDAASDLMINLMQLKKSTDMSMLILAHTPKRMTDLPITANDLAGSKKLFNFFDCVMAMGKSLADENVRYVKQLKVRDGEFTYTDNNVMLYELVKEDTMLYMKESGTGRELDQLQPTSFNKMQVRMTKVRELKQQGRSLSEIAEVIGMSKATACRLSKIIDREKKLMEPQRPEPPADCQ